MIPNEDVEDEVVADIIWSAMIDEGDIVMIIDCERKESEFIWTGDASAGGHQEPNAISSVHLKCIMLTNVMHDTTCCMGCDGQGVWDVIGEV